ncbi:hypothetical protein LguiA_009347 [Lonicera macranthoides]
MYQSHSPFLFENEYTTTTTNNITINPIIPHNIQYEDEETIFLQLQDLIDQQQQQQLPFSTNINLVCETSTNKIMGGDEKCSKKIAEEDHQEPEKLLRSRRCTRSCKKDRHSKINTAKGPRDRRIRLSVDMARRFFGLQDLLGFDKPSYTVEWLLTNSKSAIKQLKISTNATATATATAATTTTTSNSDREVLSGIDESPLAAIFRSTSNERKGKKKKSTSRGFHKITSALIKRESREKARERARERTRGKKIHKLLTSTTFSKQGMGMELEMDVHKLSKSEFLESTSEDQEHIFGDSLLIRGSDWTHYSTSSFIHHHQHNPRSSQFLMR